MSERPDATEPSEAPVTANPARPANTANTANATRRSIADSRPRRPGAVPAAAAHPKVAGAVLMIGVVVLLIVIAALPLL